MYFWGPSGLLNEGSTDQRASRVPSNPVPWQQVGARAVPRLQAKGPGMYKAKRRFPGPQSTPNNGPNLQEEPKQLLCCILLGSRLSQ